MKKTRASGRTKHLCQVLLMTQASLCPPLSLCLPLLSLMPPSRQVPQRLLTRELLGVDYLLGQTRQPLVVDPDSEETENMLEDVDEGEDEEDEGFGEDQTLVSSLTDDPSFSLSSTQPVPSFTQPDASFTPGASASPDESVASDSAGVLDKVDTPCGVSCGAQESAISGSHQPSGEQYSWQNLLDYDKKRVMFAVRHQSRLDTGSLQGWRA
ncbi:uncharacterized protein [Garra rufa]|uniref:uncharacterized protein n=1 Tax=Garra rufa TaxID=137080 RepID=UPI003CCE5B98